MCTVSWTAVRDGYDLFFNRDELHTRAPETAAAINTRNGIDYLAPGDGDHGGTWLAVNRLGLTVCLLNDYGAAWRPWPGQPRHSRGHLVRYCAEASTHAEVIAALQAQPLIRTMPFQLLVISPKEGATKLKWQGGELIRYDQGATAPPLTSSSFATNEVIAARLWRFGSFVRLGQPVEVAQLDAYHRQHDPFAGAYSVLMSRPDAATRSICRVTVDQTVVRLSYSAVSRVSGSPVVQAPTALTLERRTQATLVA